MKPLVLEVLTSLGCAHCHTFLEFWKTIAPEWPNVTMREISILTPEGQEMSVSHQIFASPGILLDHELVAMGGFNKEKFLAQLTERSAA